MIELTADLTESTVGSMGRNCNCENSVFLESIGADLKQTMEGVAGNRQVMDQEFAAVRRQIDERVQPLEWASGHFSRQLAVPVAVKRRRKTR